MISLTWRGVAMDSRMTKYYTDNNKEEYQNSRYKRCVIVCIIRELCFLTVGNAYVIHNKIVNISTYHFDIC